MCLAFFCCGSRELREFDFFYQNKHTNKRRRKCAKILDYLKPRQSLNGGEGNLELMYECMNIFNSKKK